MPNSGFKGRVIQLSEIAINGAGAGANVSFRVLFTDGEGVVHAQTKHVVSLTDDESLRSTAKPFLDACIALAERLHFEEPNDPIKFEEIRRGIAETIAFQDDPSNEPGKQG